MEKISYEQLVDMLDAARAKAEVGSKWQHYKGTEYLVKDIVLIEATNEVSVLYASSVHPDVSFVRPLVSWLQTVEWNGETLPRFTKLS